MKNIILYIIVLFLTSCCTSRQSPKVQYSSDSSLSIRSYRLQGNEKINKGDWEGAYRDFIKVIELVPNYDTAFYNLGKISSKLGHNKEAIAYYTKAIEVNAHYLFAYYNRGNSKANLGDIQGAIDDYTEAIKINPQYTKAYLNRGLNKAKETIIKELSVITLKLSK